MRLVMVAFVFTMTMVLPVAAMAAETEEVTVKAKGMYCLNCESRVQAALGGLVGVHSVNADRTSETAVVTYDPSMVTPEDLVAAIDEHTAYVGGLVEEDETGAATAEGSADGSEASASDGEAVASADIEPASSSREGASVLPMGSLAVAGGAVLVLVIAGGAWMAVHR